jgi:hypothetical protein
VNHQSQLVNEIVPKQGFDERGASMDEYITTP